MTISVIGDTGAVQGTNGATSIAITVPTGVTTAHFGVLVSHTSGSTAATVTATGWTSRVANPSGQGNQSVTILTRLGGQAAGNTITVNYSAANSATVRAMWFDTGGQDIESLGAVYVRNGVSGTSTQFPGVTVSGARDIILVAADRTTGSPTVSSWSPSTPANVSYTLSADRTTRAHGELFATYAQASSGTSPTFTATMSLASGNAVAVQIVMTPVVTGAPAYSGTLALGATGTLSFSATTTMPPAATVTWSSQVSPTSLTLGWITSGGGTTFRAVASTSSTFTSPIYGNFTTRPASGWVTSQVTGLSPSTSYYTGLEVDGVLLTSGRGQYTTAHTALTASKVVTSSCNYTGSAHAVFTQIKTEAPDFFIHQGDIAYPGTFDVAISEPTWRANFTSSVTSSTFKPMLASVTMRYSPDNHDGPNSNTASGADAWSAQVSSNVRELTGETYAVTTQGFYSTYVHAGVRYIELDPWTFRSASTDPNTSSKTMLGTAQRAWFLNLLQTATEPAIMVMVHFPLYSNLVAGGRWGDYPDERVVIGNAISALPTAQKNKIIFFGGDSHAINADDGTNAMWGRPSLNASPLNQSAGLSSGTWNIANIDVPDTRGYYSRMTFTPSSSLLTMQWDAVQDDGTVLASWTTTFPVGPETHSGTLALGATGTLSMSQRSAMRGSLPLGATGTLTLLPPGVVTPPPTNLIFHTPYVQRRVEIAAPLAALINFSVAVLRINGQWVETEFPSEDQINAADLYFPGGYDNPVDQATADILRAAGYQVN